MPIKFRCQHCRQFLGISRAKAEQVVDCPTCGRSIRVPNLEGKVAPLPHPKLDLKDESLIAALERLADIGAEENGARLVLAGDDALQDETDGELGRSLEPIPVHEPAVVEAPVPIDPPAMQQPLPASIVTPAPRSAAATSEPTMPVDAVPGTLSDLAAERGPPRSRPDHERSAGTLSWFAVAAVGLVALGGGYLVGRWTAPPADVADTNETDATSSALDAKPPLPPDLHEAITGQIKFKKGAGHEPDVGACVIALPVERGGTIRLSAVGLRPGDSSEDWRVARAGLRALGGDASIVDEEGNYRIALPGSGEYRILVLSRYQGRDVDDGLPAEVDRTLSRFFEAPRQLIGQRRYEFDDDVPWNGTATIEWGHTFAAEES